MLGEIDKEMILKFLERNYPVSRVKDKMRFKRGIIFDDGSIYFLSDASQRLVLYHKLIDTLITVFNCDETTCKVILCNFLQLKQPLYNT